MSKWTSIKKRLPPLDRVVMVCYRNHRGAPVYAWGARLDDVDGWLWGIQTCGYCGGVTLGQDAGWNSIEADDDYEVTHWQPLPKAPFRSPDKAPAGTLRLHPQ